MLPFMQLTTLATSLLKDTLSYLNQIDPKDYHQPIELLSQASIGQHSRHFIEFFQCLLTQAAGKGGGVVNYDKRQRNQRIEQEPAYAAQVVVELIDQLECVNAPKQLRLEACYEDDQQINIASTFERELLYNIEHTIHHLAIIKIGLHLVAPQIQLPVHFGVAASTIKYRRTICAQ